ncbi:MAG: hypothetical protein JNL57_10035 [Bacteroidetes bacterium]|nr:hypothetical protein [Bacteroidota bacterium]
MKKNSNKISIFQQYEACVLETGARPGNVFDFCSKAGIAEPAFYEKFGSLEGLENALIAHWFEETAIRIKSEDVFLAYGAREKLLALYFAFFEDMVSHRSYMLLLSKGMFQDMQHLKSLDQLHTVFKNHVGQIVTEGVANGEFEDRKPLTGKYVNLVWLNFLFVLKFWIEDRSAGMERTDACIEKSLSLTLDMMGRNTLDQLWDFGKFMFAPKA